MPAFILKVTRARDLYVEWSTVVDDLTRTGTRAEFLEHLAARDPGLLHDPDHCPQARLARVDATGTSALYPTPSSPFGGWDSTGLMVEQRGILRRSDLEAYVAAMEADDPEKAWALVVPFDDELPAERCPCGLVSRGLVDGVCARTAATEGPRPTRTRGAHDRPAHKCTAPNPSRSV